MTNFYILRLVEFYVKGLRQNHRTTEMCGGYAEDGGVTVKLIWLSPKFFIISPDLRYFETLKCIERNDKKLGECYDINKCRR